MEMMDTFNIVLITLIFISLVIIIGIFGKNLKKFREVGKSPKLGDRLGDINKEEKKFSFGFIFSRISELFVWIAEAIISNARKALQNAHSGLMDIKNKKAKKNGPAIQRKEDFEIVEEMEEIPENKRRKIFGGSNELEGENIQETKNILAEEKTEKTITKNVNFSENRKENRKLKEFFYKKPLDTELLTEETGTKEDKSEIQNDEEKSSKKGFFSKIGLFKKTAAVQNKKILTEESFNDYSDGIMKVRKRTDDDEMNQRESSINGVVRSKVSSKEEATDDELGVDRKILEKKILQKIASSPKDIEGYRQLGELYIKMKNFEDARSAYKFILKISARDVDASSKLEKIKLLKRLK